PDPARRVAARPSRRRRQPRTRRAASSYADEGIGRAARGARPWSPVPAMVASGGQRGAMQIPYGRSNFEEIRRKGFFYVDKTPCLPLLERAPVGSPLFLRPRRFGKSTLLSMLEHYYDLARKDQFDELFGGLWVHAHPTPERSSYLVLALDFSGVDID